MKNTLRLLIAAFLVSASMTVSAQDFVKLGTSHDSDFWGSTSYAESEFGDGFPSALDYIGVNGRNQITSLSMNDSNVADVFAGVYGSFDALVVSESIQTLNGTNNDAFENYVEGGGCLIVIGDHGDNEDSFLNDVFDYGMSSTGANDGTDTFEIQPAASGTAFAGGPASLLATNASALYKLTPGVAPYSGSEGIGIFTVEQGAGTVTALSYDYCCTDFETTSQNILDWYEVLDRSFAQCGFINKTTPVPASSRPATTIAIVLLALFGLVALRNRNLVRLRS